MIKKTLCFNNPAYISLRDAQLVIKLPEVEKAVNLTEDYKKTTEVTPSFVNIFSKMVLPCFSSPSMYVIVQAWKMQKFIESESKPYYQILVK